MRADVPAVRVRPHASPALERIGLIAITRRGFEVG
jgi:hypothetical protein